MKAQHCEEKGLVCLTTALKRKENPYVGIIFPTITFVAFASQARSNFNFGAMLKSNLQPFRLFLLR